MLFIGIALLIAAGLAVLVSADAGALFGLSQDQTVSALPLVILLVVLAGSLFARRLPLRHMLGGAAMWVAIFAIIITGYSYRFELAGFAARVMGELAPEAGIVADDGRTVTFRRGLGSAFYLQAEVNGQPLRMIFDTGASAVVLTHADAVTAGIDTDNLIYTVPVQTANGTSEAALVRLDSMSVGGISRDRIRAYVTRAGALDTSLLGMSFLETLEGYSVSRETLELKG